MEGSRLFLSGLEEKTQTSSSLLKRKSFTFNQSPDADVHPTWSPDGQRIAFVRKNSKRSQIIVIPTLGGTPEIEVVTIDENHTITTSLSWLHDSQHIVYERWKSEFDSEIRLVNIHTKESETLVAAPKNGGRHYSAAVAPDGRSMASFRMKELETDRLFDFRSLTSSQITDEVGHVRELPGRRMVRSHLCIQPRGSA